MLNKTLKKPKATHHYLRVYSRHNTIEELRRSIPIKGKKVVYRHGSTTVGDFDYEINSVEAVKHSADKLLMKQHFDLAEVNHAKWVLMKEYNSPKFNEFLKAINFPEKKIIIKHRFGSRGTGNYLIGTKEQLVDFAKQRKQSLNNYIVEEFKNYTVEYRLHVTEKGCFYTCRKVLKSNTPKNERFQRHDDNCNWLIETNPKFDKPKNWDDIVKDCVKALRSIEADVLAFDVKCTSKKKSKDGTVSWILIESCSAPSFGDITLEKYKEQLPLIVKNKYDK